MDETLFGRISLAVLHRQTLLSEPHTTAFRLFNGFLEGYPALSIEVYGRTAVIHDYAHDSVSPSQQHDLTDYLLQSMPWVTNVLWKKRNSASEMERAGTPMAGSALETRVSEGDVTYAINLQLNQDTSLYLDTRNLRTWLRANMLGQSVLNTFAYTCSLGVSAKAGGAIRVLNADINPRFLALGRMSYGANRYAIRKVDFLANDFWPHMSQLVRDKERFDTVILDPPFYSATSKGRVDTEHNFGRLINKVRPLVTDQGSMIVINNALFVSGAEFMADLDNLCSDGYLTVDGTIAVPDDCTGYPPTIAGSPVTDPAPFNHATKIAILKVRRKTIHADD